MIHGAAPCPVPVKQRLIEWLGPVVVEYYAATEGLGTLVDSATWLAHPGTVGRPMAPGLVKVADEAGNDLPPGEVGLVFLQAPAATKFDYYGDTEKTTGAFRGDYFTLGDMGYMDAEGFLYLTDRTANLIISGGVNIYPAEVDGVLLEHPAVHDVATIGVPDDDWGEAVKAVVQLGRRGRGDRRAGRRAHGLLPGPPGPFQVPPQRRLRVGAAAGGYWEDLQEEAARPVQGRAAQDGIEAGLRRQS